MKKIENVRALLVDLDDTVFDFKKAEHVALEAALKTVGIEPKPEVVQDYVTINLAIWKELERGEISRDELRVERFRRFYRSQGIDREATELADLYVENLSKGHYWIEGSREALIELKKDYKLYIASNGTSWIQRSRINSSDLESLVDDIFISEEIGVNKPAKGFFDCCFAKMDVSPAQCLMVGDSLSSDIAGGINAGLRTVWINPNGKTAENGVKADYMVASLSELVNLL